MEKNSENTAANAPAKNDSQLEGYNPKQFLLIKIIYSILSVLNIIVMVASFAIAGFSMNDARIATECIGTMNTKIVSSNENFYSIVFELTNDSLSDDEKLSRVKAGQEKIMSNFMEIDAIKAEFDSLERNDKEAEEKLEEAWTSIEKYREKLSEFDVAVGNSDTKSAAKKIHREFSSIAPIMAETTALIDEAAVIQKDASYKVFTQKAQSVVWVIVTMLAIFAAGIVMIILMQRSAKNTALELKKKKEEVEVFSRKLFSSDEKSKAAALTNPLTSLKNRYAMEDDIKTRLENDNFLIANFSFDSICDFNENYGRDFSDKFLITVAERLKTDYSQYAEIYNVTPEEFCFVFHSDVSEGQAKKFVESISRCMTSSYTIFNISVQRKISGCIYHYHAGNYSDLNSLFIMLDKTLHKIKDEGGNRILQVNNE